MFLLKFYFKNLFTKLCSTIVKYLSQKVLIGAFAAICSAGVVPAIPAAVPAALTVGTYATSYNAHAINHAIATPYVAAAPAAIAVAPAAYAAAPLTYSALATPFSAPIIAGRR